MEKRKKYSNFSEFILNDKKVVLKTLIVISRYFGFLLFSLIAYASWVNGFKEASILFGIIALIGLWGIIQFHRHGGLKAFPDASTAEMLWGKDEIKVKK